MESVQGGENDGNGAHMIEEKPGGACVKECVCVRKRKREEEEERGRGHARCISQPYRLTGPHPAGDLVAVNSIRSLCPRHRPSLAPKWLHFSPPAR